MQRFSRTLSVVAAALVALGSASTAYARELCPPGPFANLCNLKLEEDSGQVIGVIMVVFFLIAIFTCLFFMILGASRYITSAGDNGKAQQARSTIIAALVGLVISLSTFFIVNILLYVFTGQGMDGLLNNIPMLVK